MRRTVRHPLRAPLTTQADASAPPVARWAQDLWGTFQRTEEPPIPLLGARTTLHRRKPFSPLPQRSACQVQALETGVAPAKPG